jgi:hypothetical protein
MGFFDCKKAIEEDLGAFLEGSFCRPKERFKTLK